MSTDPHRPLRRVLVAYASKHGSTEEIAAAVAARIRSAGLRVDCRPAGDVDDVSFYDAIVLGSAVYSRRWRREARRFLARHEAELAARDLWVFSSGPVGDEPDLSWGEPPKVAARVQRLGARDHVVFGGRLPLEPANFVERAMVQNTAPEHRDLRDWADIEAWGDGIAAVLAPEPTLNGVA